MSRESPVPIEMRRRAVERMRWIEQEAIPSGLTHGRKLSARANPEVNELARAYGVTAKTLRKWARRLDADAT